ncbi:hypothetical protein MTO96_003215 [Rhipicephalus appendiculatus]
MAAACCGSDSWNLDIKIKSIEKTIAPPGATGETRRDEFVWHSSLCAVLRLARDGAIVQTCSYRCSRAWTSVFSSAIDAWTQTIRFAPIAGTSGALAVCSGSDDSRDSLWIQMTDLYGANVSFG